MPPTSLDGRPPTVLVELAEWERVGPAQDARLVGLSLAGDAAAQRAAETLHGRVEVREGYDGLEIGSGSHVGRVDIGPLRVVVRPKLSALPLARLLRYAYGMRDLGLLDETRIPTSRDGLQDLLVAMLADEVEELLRRGLARRHLPLVETLESPRGQIQVQEIVRRGGVREARLPCRHFERRADWHLNRVLRAGLQIAKELASDRGLRRRVGKLSDGFGDVVRTAGLDTTAIDEAERGLTRLTAASAPALTIVRLLHDAHGSAVDGAIGPDRTPGFLFDMNAFFQRLLSRFLRDYLADRHVVDEQAIRGVFAYGAGANPRGRKPPRPRPDFALFRGQAILGFLDAKYRDVWASGFPAEWLYQLSIYALASPGGVAVLLYASMAEAARDERVDVRSPWPLPGNGETSVIFRPVPMRRLAELLDTDRPGGRAAECRNLADGLVALRVGEPT